MQKEEIVILGAIAADLPIILWGAPGTGKTASIYDIAKKRGVHVETLIGSTLDPVEVGGQPFLGKNNKIELSPPPWARRIRACLDKGQEAWLFLDELSCAPPSVQAALLRVIQERKVADIDLEGCRILAAANPADTAVDGGVLGAPTANRLAHVKWKPDVNGWIAGELSGWGKQRSKECAAAASRITAWIGKRNDALLDPPGDTRAGEAWPSPRSWSAAIKLLAFVPDKDARFAVASCVGDAAAAEWAHYDAERDLPSPEDILSRKAKVPKRGDRAQASMLGVVAAALMNHEKRAERISTAWSLLSSEMRPDVAIPIAKALVMGDPDGEIPKAGLKLAERL